MRGSLCAIKYTVNERRKYYRAAVVVSRKVNKSAVVRNRIRRRIYEVLRKHQTDIAKPYDLVITVYHDQIGGMDAAELDRMISGQLKQAGVLSKYAPAGSQTEKPRDIVDTKKENS